jgi:basic membrane protein A
LDRWRDRLGGLLADLNANQFPDLYRDQSYFLTWPAAGILEAIGKDWDWYRSAPDCAPVMLTSILKRVDVAVFKTIQNLVVIGAVGNQFLGTLENEGVGLAPFHDFADQVPTELVAELAELAGDIAAGTVQVRG